MIKCPFCRGGNILKWTSFTDTYQCMNCHKVCVVMELENELDADWWQHLMPVDTTEPRNQVTVPHTPLSAPSTGMHATSCFERYYHESRWTREFCYLPMDHFGMHLSLNGYKWTN